MEDHACSHPGDTILMDDPAVTSVPVLESSEPLVDLALNATLLFDDRLADPKGLYRMVRAGLAERLGRAASSLPAGVRLLIVEGYRPPELQLAYFDAYLAEMHQRYPRQSEEELHSLASRYVAPPGGLPPHCAGAAIDLTLADDNGIELEMGTQINESPEASDGRCYFASPDISRECRSNRALLSSVLGGAGLVNYPTEWWHWSYGDRYWALVTGSRSAIYGLSATP